MKKILKILLDHSIPVISIMTIIFGEFMVCIIRDYNISSSFLYGLLSVVAFCVVFIAYPCIIILSGAYAVMFFRKENFLTPILPLSLICLSKTNRFIIGEMCYLFIVDIKFCLILFLICLFIRITAIILIRIYKEKLKEWTGEEKVTSDIVFWARVLFKKLIKSIDPNFKG